MKIVQCIGVSLRAVAAAAILAAASLAGIVPSASAQDTVTYLFPAPPFLPAFGPIQLAVGKGYFAEEDIEVEFAVGQGGVDVAKQIGAGNAPFGGILADGPIIVRANGVPVKAVASFGGQGFMQLVVREDSGINSPADLAGKDVSVMSFQDTTFYALLGVMASANLTRDDVNVQAAGPQGVWQLLAEGEVQAMAGVPDWIPPVQAAGVPIKILRSDEFFPHMAQAIGASDEIIESNPDLVRRFVRAAMRGMQDIIDDPEASADEFVTIVPRWEGQEGYIRAVFKFYAELIYPGQETLGEINAERLASLQEFYLAQGIIREAVPVEDLYTNEFVR